MLNAMTRVLRKQDRNDFISRIERLDPAFASTPATARDERKPWEFGNASRKSDSPILTGCIGFALAMGALFVANDPDRTQDLLLQSGWPAQFIGYGMNGVSILIIGLIIFYLVNLVRIINPRASGRWNAAGLVAGAIAAIGVSSVDPSHIDAGLQYAGIENTAELLTMAQARTASLTNVDWASVVMVSSSPK